MTSVEPGFYKEGEWGIRTESVYVCKRVDVSEIDNDAWQIDADTEDDVRLWRKPVAGLGTSDSGSCTLSA